MNPPSGRVRLDGQVPSRQMWSDAVQVVQSYMNTNVNALREPDGRRALFEAAQFSQRNNQVCLAMCTRPGHVAIFLGQRVRQLAHVRLDHVHHDGDDLYGQTVPVPVGMIEEMLSDLNSAPNRLVVSAEGKLFWLTRSAHHYDVVAVREVVHLVDQSPIQMLDAIRGQGGGGAEERLPSVRPSPSPSPPPPPSSSSSSSTPVLSLLEQPRIQASTGQMRLREVRPPFPLQGQSIRPSNFAQPKRQPQQQQQQQQQFVQQPPKMPVMGNLERRRNPAPVNRPNRRRYRVRALSAPATMNAVTIRTIHERMVNDAGEQPELEDITPPEVHVEGHFWSRLFEPLSVKQAFCLQTCSSSVWTFKWRFVFGQFLALIEGIERASVTVETKLTSPRLVTLLRQWLPHVRHCHFQLSYSKISDRVDQFQTALLLLVFRNSRQLIRFEYHESDRETKHEFEALLAAYNTYRYPFPVLTELTLKFKRHYASTIRWLDDTGVMSQIVRFRCDTLLSCFKSRYPIRLAALRVINFHYEERYAREAVQFAEQHCNLQQLEVAWLIGPKDDRNVATFFQRVLRPCRATLCRLKIVFLWNIANVNDMNELATSLQSITTWNVNNVTRLELSYCNIEPALLRIILVELTRCARNLRTLALITTQPYQIISFCAAFPLEITACRRLDTLFIDFSDFTAFTFERYPATRPAQLAQQSVIIGYNAARIHVRQLTLVGLEEFQDFGRLGSKYWTQWILESLVSSVRIDQRLQMNIGSTLSGRRAMSTLVARLVTLVQTNVTLSHLVLMGETPNEFLPYLSGMFMGRGEQLYNDQQPQSALLYIDTNLMTRPASQVLQDLINVHYCQIHAFW